MNTTNTELDRNQREELAAIHKYGHQVLQDRATQEDADRVMQEVEAEQQADDGVKQSSGMMDAMLTMLLPGTLFTDGVVAIPPLEDRFESLGLPPATAFLVAITTALLIMCMETLAALAWFRAYDRSLQSRRYVALVGWTLICIIVVSGPVLMGLSQLLLVMDGSADDSARLYKEIALVMLFGGAHLLLVSSGRYLESSKKAAVRWITAAVARFRKGRACRSEKKVHDLLSEAYRAHVRNATRAVKDGFEDVEVGPFEDPVLALIRVRHANVDETIRRFGERASSAV